MALRAIINTRKRWAKPTKDEEATKKKAIEVCSVCWQEDAEKNSKHISWSEYDICGLWVLESCHGDHNSDKYICSSCLTGHN